MNNAQLRALYEATKPSQPGFHTVNLEAPVFLRLLGDSEQLDACRAELGSISARIAREDFDSVFDGHELWCVHVHGPGTIIAQPDYATAVRRAQEWIAVFAKVRESREPSPYGPIMHCNVEPWPYGPEAHAAALAEHGGAPEDIC